MPKPATIDPRAAVDPSASLGAGVTVGPFAVIGPHVTVGDGTTVGANVVLDGHVSIGANNILHPFCAIGGPPQDFGYAGDPTQVVIGDGNTFREQTTIHRGTTKGGGITRVGSHGYFMVGSHIAHDCTVGDHVLFANAGTLAGHVEVGDHAVVGAFSGVHQFCRVGPYAYIGGYSTVTRDAIPFCTTVGNRALCYGINRVGLRRLGKSADTIAALDAATRMLFRPGPTREQALSDIVEQWGRYPEVMLVVDFVRGTRRGVTPIRLDVDLGADE